MRSWLLALAAVLVCGPWPGWQPGSLALLMLCGGLLVLARPRGRSWLPWSAAAVALAIAAWPAERRFEPGRAADSLEDHCRGMVRTAEAVAADAALIRLLSAAGEAVDPALPFALLDREARGVDGRSIYLADDRGRVIAWGGAGNSLPDGIRTLGQRQSGLSWSAGGADLWLREPLLLSGRLVGAVIVSDRSPLESRRIWGMQAGRGRLVGIGNHHEGAVAIEVPGRPGVVVPVAVIVDTQAEESPWRWLPWLLLAAISLRCEPRLAWLAAAFGLGSALAGARPAPGLVFGALLLLGGAGAGRLASVLSPARARLLVGSVMAAAFVAAVLLTPVEAFQWLPLHLTRPGWGGAWMVALAWLCSGWPGWRRGPRTLDRRLYLAVLLALLGLATFFARLPVQLARSESSGTGVELPRHDLESARILPVDAAKCRLDDLAPVLAERWRLTNWSTPSDLMLLDSEDRVVSRWGELGPAGPAVRVVRSWPLDEPAGWLVVLRVAAEPWRWLQDWRPGLPVDRASAQAVWYAVLTRSGEIAATVHPEIENLDAMRAGELFHARGGWATVVVDGEHRLARVRREGEWLVVAVANHPSVADWVVRTAIALLWALLGSLIAFPPVISRQQISTFGGRLRLLVAGGVVLPLVILTLFLHQRIAGQETRYEQTRASEALRAARYTAVHLGGGFAVDDELASWLASGWGGEVVLWDGASLAAVSRPDLVSTGALPPLPLPETFPPYLLGRDDTSVHWWRDLVVAAGPVDLQGRRLLLHLFLSGTSRSASELGAVDWLLTGACLSALLALVLTTRIEERLSFSLRELVALARKLVEGEPVEPLRRPPETDLAEVLDAVGSMNEQVQQREISLRYQEELLRITLATLESAVVVLEPNGARRFANPSARELEAEHGDLVIEHLRSVIEDASVGGSAAKMVQPVPGRDLTWRIGVAEVPFPDGTRGLVAVVDDVTGLVRADRARQLNELARIVAHEVKNPLTPVRLWVQELQASLAADDPELRHLVEEACREIAVQVARLQETANSFSNLVALEEWTAEPVQLAAILEAVPSGSDIFERRGIVFHRAIPPSPPPPVIGDRHWIRRAVANVVQNSIDALGDRPGTVTMRLREKGDRVVLEIEDTAGGVPDERLPELFAPHFSTSTAGSGLGLALVHQVVTRCQGTVEASRGARGLLVRLEFPVPPLPIDGGGLAEDES